MMVPGTNLIVPVENATEGYVINSLQLFLLFFISNVAFVSTASDGFWKGWWPNSGLGDMGRSLSKVHLQNLSFSFKIKETLPRYSSRHSVTLRVRPTPRVVGRRRKERTLGSIELLNPPIPSDSAPWLFCTRNNTSPCCIRQLELGILQLAVEVFLADVARSGFSQLLHISPFGKNRKAIAFCFSSSCIEQ